jgi:hypothetical protein
MRILSLQSHGVRGAWMADILMSIAVIAAIGCSLLLYNRIVLG